MRKLPFVAILAMSAALPACYRADIQTGLAPSGEVIEDEWVVGFVGGLAMVDDVDAEDCTNGIASVMTRQSFLNVVVNVLTWGIVSPMEVRVECAAAPTAQLDAIEAGTTRSEVSAALTKAAMTSAEIEAPVYVRFTD